MQTYLLALGFLAVGGILYYVSTLQAKKAAVMKTLKIIPLNQAKAGDTGLFVGEVSGTPVNLPYVDKNVAYFEFELRELVKTPKQGGGTTTTWKFVDKQKSRAPFMVKEGSVSILIPPTGIELNTMPLYDGKVVGLNKDVFDMIQLISGGRLRPDLMTKELKINMRGLPVGEKVTAVGTLQVENGQLSLSKSGNLGGLYTTTDTGQIVKGKEGAAKWMKIGAVVMAVVAVITVIVGLTQK